MQAGGKTIDGGPSGRFGCPYCASHEVDRMLIASVPVDSCQCGACGARWDEDPLTGEHRGRADRSSVLVRLDPASPS